MQLGDLGTHLNAQLGVQVGERLVHQEDLGLANDGAAEGDALTLTVEIPANTTAEVYVPSAAADKVTESGRALDGRSDLKVAGWDDGYTLVRLGSGRYEFRSTLK